MASGGNAIRLPDGTRIEVLAVDDAEYARAIDAGMNGPAVPGVAEGRPMRSEPRSSEGEESREPREHCACGGFWRGAIDGPYAVCASCGATREDPPVPDPAPIRGERRLRARFRPARATGGGEWPRLSSVPPWSHPRDGHSPAADVHGADRDGLA
jgi:hypothetical protein